MHTIVLGVYLAREDGMHDSNSKRVVHTHYGRVYSVVHCLALPVALCPVQVYV